MPSFLMQINKDEKVAQEDSVHLISNLTGLKPWKDVFNLLSVLTGKKKEQRKKMVVHQLHS